jgi:phytanoyl-CoA hydroxylase
MLTADLKAHFDTDGYVVVRQLFTPDETTALREHYMRLREQENAGAEAHIQAAMGDDPLLRYPRLLQMHRMDETSLHWLLDKRIAEVLNGLLGREPFAVQTMLYFKPAGARGQALHQDNKFLRAQPGTCIAAWMALDKCDEENGCLQVVPGSQTWPLLCNVKADLKESFTDSMVPIPPGTEVVPVRMEAGDVLFFNGQLVHGSYPNRTADRFRRSLIAHYIQGDAQQVASFYHPVLRMDGSVVEMDLSPNGSQCGVWVTEDGKTVIEMGNYEVMEKQVE